MGCGPSSQVVINLDRKIATFFAGETVTGTVQFFVANDELEVDQIDLSLIGEVGHYTEKTSTVNGKRTTNTTFHDLPFLSTKQVLALPELGQKELKLKKGEYSWPFQMDLPDHIPPTVGNPNIYPHIRYFIQVLIDKAWYKSNTEENRYITVNPRVNILQSPNCLPSVFGNPNWRDIVLKGTLNKLGFEAGEVIHVTMEINNPRQALIKQITVTMIRNLLMGPVSKTTTLSSRVIPEMMRRNEPKRVQSFDVMLPPPPMIPSYQYEGGLQHVVHVNVSYLLRFHVNVQGIMDDFEMIAPFVIGTESSSS